MMQLRLGGGQVRRSGAETEAIAGWLAESDRMLHLKLRPGPVGSIAVDCDVLTTAIPSSRS